VAVPYLNEALKDSAWAVRREAAEALGKMGADAKAAVPYLIEALEDSNSDICRKAAIALGEIGADAKAAIPYLIEAFFSDQGSRFRSAVADAFKSIAGVDLFKLKKSPLFQQYVKEGFPAFDFLLLNTFFPAGCAHLAWHSATKSALVIPDHFYFGVYSKYLYCVRKNVEAKPDKNTKGLLIALALAQDPLFGFLTQMYQEVKSNIDPRFYQTFALLALGEVKPENFYYEYLGAAKSLLRHSNVYIRHFAWRTYLKLSPREATAKILEMLLGGNNTDLDKEVLVGFLFETSVDWKSLMRRHEKDVYDFVYQVIQEPSYPSTKYQFDKKELFREVNRFLDHLDTLDSIDLAGYQILKVGVADRLEKEIEIYGENPSIGYPARIFSETLILKNRIKAMGLNLLKDHDDGVIPDEIQGLIDLALSEHHEWVADPMKMDLTGRKKVETEEHLKAFEQVLRAFIRDYGFNKSTQRLVKSELEKAKGLIRETLYYLGTDEVVLKTRYEGMLKVIETLLSEEVTPKNYRKQQFSGEPGVQALLDAIIVQGVLNHFVFEPVIQSSDRQEYDDPRPDHRGEKIRAVKFVMGSPESESGRSDDETQHDMYLTKDFDMGATEVTQKQWDAVLVIAHQYKGIDLKGLSLNPSYFSGDDRPVEQVSYFDVKKFINILNKLTKDSGFKYHLPTEAEWEYAARGKTTTAYSFGNDASVLGRYGVVVDSKQTALVKSKGDESKNGFNLYDMHGNVWEWTDNSYAKYSATTVDSPSAQDDDIDRVIRGGSWSCGALPSGARYARSAFRTQANLGNRDDDMGFRLVRTQK